MTPRIPLTLTAVVFALLAWRVASRWLRMWRERTAAVRYVERVFAVPSEGV